MNKTYSELITIPTFEERYEYLKLNGTVGKDTFGFARWANQVFYTSLEWRNFRRTIILRDNGCDLACGDFEIFGKIILHHITPITYDDVINRKAILMDPENLIITTMNTHNAIHYGSKDLLKLGPVERTKNDTCPWKVNT